MCQGTIVSADGKQTTKQTNKQPTTCYSTKNKENNNLDARSRTVPNLFT